MIATAIVLAKEPQPGRVKTRLSPALTATQAAQVAAAALRDTLRVVENLPVQQRILAFDGDARNWLPAGWRHVAQAGGDLDVRLGAAFAAAGRGPAVLVGMDTPQLRTVDVAAFDAMTYDACLGLCPDGGYWAIGFSDPAVAPAAIRGVPMSQADTAPRQYDRLVALGLRVQLLSSLVDVDTLSDATEVARIAPSTEFARTLAAVRAPSFAGSARR